MAKKTSGGALSQLKATPIKKLQKRVDADNDIIGAQSNEYLNLEDGKTLKIRIFPAHPGHDNFYIPRKCYWLSFQNKEGDIRRGTVLDSKVHGGTKYDLVEEYAKFAKKKHSRNAEIIDAITSTAQTANSLNPSFSWVCYADKISGDEPLRAKQWEFKKMVRDGLNGLAFSEDEDEVIEFDPFTDPEDGIPVLVSYNKTPNKKKGENYYKVAFPKNSNPRPLTEEEAEYFLNLKPLEEVLSYGLRDFERALEGLQNFDDEHEIGLFDDEDWMEIVEKVRAQYDEDDSDEEEEKPKKKSTKKVSKEEPEDDDVEDEEEEEEEEAPKKKAPKKASKKVEEPEDEEEEEEEAPKKKAPKKTAKKAEEPEEEEEEEEEADEVEEDELDDLDRGGLKKYIRDNDLEVSIKKSMTEDDIREAIRAAQSDDEEEADEEGEDEGESGLDLSAIKKRLAAGKKK